MRIALLALLPLAACAGAGTDDTDADGDGFSLAAGDCDDARADVHPGADELCDGVDQDCDGVTDNAPVDGTWFPDADGDGYGVDDVAQAACAAADGLVQDASDCDDAQADIHPGAVEHCDDVDEDCDGAWDNDAVDARTFYPDNDRDGYGTDNSSITTCEHPPGYAAGSDDCDDSDGRVHPGADDTPGDGVDSDCSHDAYAWPADNGIDASVARITGNHGLGFPTCVAALGDIDFDGWGDVFIGDAAGADADATDAGYVQTGAFTGTRTAADARAVLDWGSAAGGYGTSCVALGDVNAHGTIDLLIGAPGAGGAQLFLGERLNAWDAAEPDAGFTDVGVGFGSVVGAAGDVDGDGLPDALIAGVAADGNGAVGVYSGAAWEAWATGPSALLTAGGGFGAAVAGLGDIDGDGLDDVAIGAPDADGGSVAVYLGGAWTAAAASLAGAEPGQGFGRSLAVDDWDGDGVPDLAVAGPGARADGSAGPEGAAWIVSGLTLRAGASQADEVAFATVRGGPADTQHALQVVAPGDVDGDLAPDLLVAAADPEGGAAGAVGLYTGPLAGAQTWEDAAVFHGDGGDAARYATVVAALGDTNRDGHGDWGVFALLDGAPGLQVYQGRAE